MAQTPSAVFEYSGNEAQVGDPLGLWTSTPVLAGAVSFGVGEADSPEAATPVFRANLPAGMASADGSLRQGETHLQALSQTLDSIPARLDGLIARSQEHGLSFDALAGEMQSGPETELLTLLTQVQSLETARAAAGDALAFSLPEDVAPLLGQAKTEFQALVERVDHEVLHFAWVETAIAGSLIARTSVRWSGDALTVWQEDIRPEQAQFHDRSVSIAAQTRHLKLRLLTTVVSGAAKVGMLLATGTLPLALPLVYQYVRRSLDQVKAIQALPS